MYESLTTKSGRAKTSTNDITGDEIATKASTAAYRNNYDQIFRRKKAVSTIKTCVDAPRYITILYGYCDLRREDGSIKTIGTQIEELPR